MIGTLKDIPAITNLAEQFRDECLSIFPFDAVHFSITIARAIKEKEGRIFIHKRNDKVVGFLVGWLSPFPAYPCIQATELFWFCQKEHRSTGAIRLIKEYIKWAKQNNAQIIYAAAVGDRANPVYKKLGFQKIESHWAIV